jgi:hypothetical protein
MSRPLGWSTARAGLLALAVAGLAAVQSPVAAVEQDQLWIYDSKGRCDPFVPLIRDGRLLPCDTNPNAAAQQSGHVPALGGILWDPGGQSIALLNGGEAKVGDEVDGYVVTAIRKEEVVLTRGADRVVVRINFEAQPPKPTGASGRKEVGGR